MTEFIHSIDIDNIICPLHSVDFKNLNNEKKMHTLKDPNNTISFKHYKNN